METRFLRTFLLVVETGSVAETARRLNITPSAVTQRIGALEAEVGQTLLARSGQTMTPSAAAVGLLGVARQMLQLEDDMKALAVVDGGSGLLRIGVIQTALTGLMPDIMRRLAVSHPGMALYLVPGASGDLYARLQQGDIDAAVLVRPHFALAKSFGWKTLRRERYLFIAPPALAGQAPAALLRSEPFIRYDRNHWGGHAVELYLRKHRIRPQERYELDSLEAILVMVSKGLGVSIVPDWPPPKPEGCVVAQTEIPDAAPREIGVLWSRASNREPLILNFARQAMAGADI